nr:hypothetical protein CFP56_19641 [Quercus suber]
MFGGESGGVVWDVLVTKRASRRSKNEERTQPTSEPDASGVVLVAGKTEHQTESTGRLFFPSEFLSVTSRLGGQEGSAPIEAPMHILHTRRLIRAVFVREAVTTTTYMYIKMCVGEETDVDTVIDTMTVTPPWARYSRAPVVGTDGV